ncbi:MAG: aminotransferase class IV [Thermoleophilaceae bacterium]
MTELACLNGSIAPSAETAVPVLDDGLLRGDGAFEVVRVYDGRPYALAEHLDRMTGSAAALRLEPPFPRAEYEREARELLEARGGTGFDGCLRLLLTRGGRRLLLTEPLPPSPDRIRLGYVTYTPTRVLDGIKSLSYAANVLCGRLARERGFDEALMVTPHGRVLEAPTASIFWVSQAGVLCTPPLGEHILASITREHLMRLVDVSECPVTSEELLGAREAFLASTTREVQPVAAVEDVELPAPGELTERARAAFRAHVERTLASPA